MRRGPVLIRSADRQRSEDAQRIRRDDRARLCQLPRWHARRACSPRAAAPSHGKAGFRGQSRRVVALRLQGVEAVSNPECKVRRSQTVTVWAYTGPPLRAKTRYTNRHNIMDLRRVQEGLTALKI